MKKRFSYFSLVLLLIFMGTNIQAQEEESGSNKETSSSYGQFNQKLPKRYRLGPVINTLLYDEYAPAISADGKTLIFQSNRDGNKWNNYWLYESKLGDNGLWSEPKAIEAINSAASSSSESSESSEEGGKKKKAGVVICGPNISYDGNTLYFSANFDGNMDIYMSAKSGDSWGAPQKVSGAVNTGDYEGFPTVTADGKRMFFMKRQAAAEGGDTEAGSESSEESSKSTKQNVLCYKLMVAKKMNDGSWGSPEELPEPINANCEKAARIMPDGETLFFASMRTGANMGLRNHARDFDIFMSRLQEGGTVWSEPVPVDFANNLSADLYVTICPNDGPTTVMYFNTDMNASHDLYYTFLPPAFAPKKIIVARGNVEDSITGDPIEAKLVMSNETRPTLSNEFMSDAETGKFSTVITEGNKYKVEVQHEDYMPYSFVWDFTSEESLINAYQRVRLVKKGIELNITVMHGDTDEPIENAQLVLKSDDNTSIDLENKGKGKFYARLDPKKKYTATATADGLGPEDGSGGPVEETWDLSEYNYGDVVDKFVKMYDEINVAFDNINFATASAVLTNESKATLDKVFAYMSDYPKVSVRIEAHTDYRGSDESNQKLSDKRAKSAYDYLISKGIPASRLESNGYGESKPTVPNEMNGKANQENMALNRRVEFKPFRKAN